MITLSFVNQQAHILSLFGGSQGFKELYMSVYSLKHGKEELKVELSAQERKISEIKPKVEDLIAKFESFKNESKVQF